MILIEDTRNKDGKHRNISSYCKKHGIELVRQKLDVGDYMIPDGRITVDTKENLLELCKNIMNRGDKARFWREVRRAKENGLTLIVLVEERGISSIMDVAKWRSKYTKVTGRALMGEIYRIHIGYGVEFIFCDKRSTGRKIVELLFPTK